MTLLSHTIVFLLWMGCTTCKASAGAACENPPLVDFGEIVSGHKSGYKESDRVQYVCNPGYTLSGSEWVTCHEENWVPQPPQCLAPCTITKQQLEAQNLLLSNGQRRTFLIQSGQWQEFTCTTGFKLTASPVEQCFDGHIRLPSCIAEKPCDYPAIENGKLSGRLEYYKNYYFPMMFGQHADYYCNDGYSTPSGEYWVRMVCSERGWSPEPKCLKKCHVRQLENGYFSANGKKVYKEGEIIKYVCNNDYDTEHEDGKVTCTKDDWSPPPRCIQPCTLNVTDMNSNNIELKWRQEELIFLHGDLVEFQCKRGYNFLQTTVPSPGRTQCSHGRVEYPKCIMQAPTEKCDSPPSIANGALTLPPLKQYDSGSSVQYSCSDYHFLQGSERIYCSEGQWTSPPVCIEPCTLSKNEMEKNNVLLQGFYENQVYFYHGDYVGFYCKQNHFGAESGTTLFQVQCQRGQLMYPRCVEREK